MNNKKYILFAIIIVISYATGRYMAPQKIKTEIHTVEVEKEVTKVEHKIVKIKENKDGSKETIIVTDSSSNQRSKEKDSFASKEVTVRDTLNISVLGGISFPLSQPVIGISAQKNLIGPVTMGLWGLSNGTVGASLGLNF